MIVTITDTQNQHTEVKSLIPLSNYIDAMKAQKHLAAGIRRVRFFLATDDAQAEAEIKAAFKPGISQNFPRPPSPSSPFYFFHSPFKKET